MSNEIHTDESIVQLMDDITDIINEGDFSPHEIMGALEGIKLNIFLSAVEAVGISQGFMGELECQ